MRFPKVPKELLGAFRRSGHFQESHKAFDFMRNLTNNTGDISLCQLQERQQRYKTLPATVEVGGGGVGSKEYEEELGGVRS